MSQVRRDRIAHNEGTFRTMNEELNAGLRELQREEGELSGFVCECGNAGCTVLVHLSLEEYEDVRRDSQRFFVAPGHEMLDSEEVVQRGTRYTVVRKRDNVREIVEASDGRRRS